MSIIQPLRSGFSRHVSFRIIMLILLELAECRHQGESQRKHRP